MKHVAIIGAGASGLFLSRLLREHPDVEIHLFDRCKQVGTKLRASGGGKANIFNTCVTPDCYNHPAFAAQILEKVTPERLLQTFESFGLEMCADEEGRVYPLSEFSQTVVDVLWNPEHPRIHPVMEYEITRVWHENGQWHVNDYPTPFDALVLASGSPANMIPKNRKQYNSYLSDLQLDIHPWTPSLVGFKIKDYPTSLAGCRVKAVASLYQNNHLIHSEFGEITFKNDGISGIVILNLSAYYNRLDNQRNCRIALNFLYGRDTFDVATHLQRHGSLQGVLHPKLHALYERQPFDIRNMELAIEEPYDLTFAQVCHGGIDVAEVDAHLAIKKHPSLYAMGEILDMDGVCGGYNLFFAFATAIIVAQNITGQND
ncbi:MAG: NAD(P)/FAD-dependent oxidoreductase [Bacteroidales bacterium]|nr:NAD(P)/FAD-dependent oxidoreductase [Bacteroidales bacterium]